MQLSKTRKSPPDPHAVELPASAQALIASDEAQSLPVVIANAFTRLRLRLRARVLRRLLLPVGPMALAVLGGGVFSKYAAHARWPRIYVSFDDAARITSAQVYELVRYVQQSNPVVLQQVLAVLARDATTMAALGASVAAIVLQQQANRGSAR
jgi:hypothetical protein